MPSSPGYKRDYAQEKRTSDARGEKPKRAARNRARREMMNLGMVKKGDGKDVDHIKPLSEGGAKTERSNLRVKSAHANRSFPRKPDGSMK
ncbi:HNH endonuclease signature motif containing protein [Burkholderia sp. BE12]|uniref:HNH endonuclease signature motif containing protein n=1 Tax=Burkholderia sp. BE12 TaxID=2082394 RepID=UPI000CF4193A|nr:HNH endonuclease signature motif containing protein [Burkholderia sp. BE12]